MADSSVDLPRPRDLLLRVLDQFVPLRHPAGCAWNREQHSKHLRLEAHGLVNDPRVKVDIGIELAGDEIVVLEGDALELQSNVDPLVASGNFEHFVGDGLDDLSARVKVLIHAMSKAH